jgi:hypothetical protein
MVADSGITKIGEPEDVANLVRLSYRRRTVICMGR